MTTHLQPFKSFEEGLSALQAVRPPKSFDDLTDLDAKVREGLEKSMYTIGLGAVKKIRFERDELKKQMESVVAVIPLMSDTQNTIETICIERSLYPFVYKRQPN